MPLSLTIFRLSFILAVLFVLSTIWKPLNEAAKGLEKLNYDIPLLVNAPAGVKSLSPSSSRSSRSSRSNSLESNTDISALKSSNVEASDVRASSNADIHSDSEIASPPRITSVTTEENYRVAYNTRKATPSTVTANNEQSEDDTIKPAVSVTLDTIKSGDEPAKDGKSEESPIASKETSSQKADKKIVATFDKKHFSETSLDALVERMSTTFSVWNDSEPHSWCHRTEGMNTGLLYVKLPKCASSTASGVTLRVADKLGHRVLGEEQKCITRFTHAIASNNLRQYGSRNQTTSFLWSIVREPSKRLLSSYFFDQVSRQKQDPTEDGVISYLQTKSDLKKSFMLRYLKLVRAAAKEKDLIREIMDNYNFIGLADRMDESLVLLSLIMQVPIADVALLSSKTAGGYDAGRSGKGCVKLVPKIKFEGVDKLLKSRDWRNNNWDEIFVKVVNRTIDRTIEHFGKDLVARKVGLLRSLSKEINEECLSKAIFPCPQTLPNHTALSEKNCYFADSGCGYRCIDTTLGVTSDDEWRQIQEQLRGDISLASLDKQQDGGTILIQLADEKTTPSILPSNDNLTSSSEGTIQVNSRKIGEDENGSRLRNLTSSTSPLNSAMMIPIQTPQTAVPLPEYFQDYIRFHRDSIQDGRVKDGVPFLVYQCYGGCAGLGGRIKAMIKSFYSAVCSRRVFLIDSPFPFPLDEYLAPNLIQWNASFPNEGTIEVPIFVRISAAKNNLTVPSHDQVGVKIAKAHGKNILDLKQVLRTQTCEAYTRSQSPLRLHAKEQQLYSWGSQILFQFTDQVISRADELKRNAQLLMSEPYVGVHLRTGAGATWSEDADRLRKAKEAGTEPFARCFRLFQDIHGFSQGYVAADSDEPRLELHAQDPSLKIAEVETFHIDRSLSKNTTKDIADFRGTFENIGGQASMDIARLGTLDLFAEFKILVDAECLIMSKSSMSYAAHFMAHPQPHCGMLVDDCTNETVVGRSVDYSLIITLFKIDQ